MIAPDYNLLTPDVVENLLEVPMEKALGQKEIDRINKIQANYDYYHGKQHLDKATGSYMYATDVDDWDGKDYEPTRFWTNYFKAFIKRKSRWQMAGNHGINIRPESDDQEDINYAKEGEKLLYELWEDNEMDSMKMQLARDRLIAGSVAAKIVYNDRTGKLHWIWHKATEVFPIYSKDGFNDLIGCDIIIVQDDDDHPDKVQYMVQRFRLEKDGQCYFSERLYDQDLEVKRTIREYASLGFDFVPIVMFNVNTLATESAHLKDSEDMKAITRIINNMMEDASDSLKFEMFAMTVVKNADMTEDTDIQIAPGAVLKVNAGNTSHPADVETVETTFQWNETFRAQFNRLKSVMHEIEGIPQITPSELNFGGMNDRALQVLYQEIIQETQEHWLAWDKDFRELFNKSVQYLKTRTSRPKFKYDKATVNKIDGELKTQMNFVLPLPDDRVDQVSLITSEIEAGLESRKHGMQRLGVKAPEDKLEEIYAELKRDIQERDPYGEGNDFGVETEVFRPIEEEVDAPIPRNNEE